jgi:DeoR family suf operon transcriptional repressor
LAPDDADRQPREPSRGAAVDPGTAEETGRGARRRITGLVANGLVSHRELKGAPGRPKHVYHLTAAAEALFPKTYSELTNELLGFAHDEDPDLIDRLFAKRRDRRIENAHDRLAGRALPERVAELTTILDEDGYLAEYEQLDDKTFRITEHNCAVLGVAERYGQACSTEIDFVRTVLPDTTVERVSHILAGARRCAYLITAK